METLEELQEYLVQLQTLIWLPAVAGFPAGESFRKRVLWLMTLEQKQEREIAGALDRFLNRAESIFPLGDEARFLLGVRMMACVEFLDELQAAELHAGIEDLLKRDRTRLLYNLLWASWPRRMEAWWLRFCARLESSQIWVDDSLPPGG